MWWEGGVSAFLEGSLKNTILLINLFPPTPLLFFLAEPGTAHHVRLQNIASGGKNIEIGTRECGGEVLGYRI